MAEDKPSQEPIPTGELIWEGKFTDPHIQPGMWVHYAYTVYEPIPEDALEENNLARIAELKQTRADLESRMRAISGLAQADILSRQYDSQYKAASLELFKLITKPTQKHAEGLVERILLENGKWQAQITGFKKVIPANDVQFLEYRERPPVDTGQVYHITVPNTEVDIQRIFSNIFQGEQTRPTKTIQTKVLTSNSTHPHALIYLATLDGQKIFGVSAADLPQRPRKNIEEMNKNAPRVWKIKNEAEKVELLRDARTTTQKDRSEENEPTAKITVETPKYHSPPEIANEIEQVVKGQPYAIRTVAVALYDHFVRPDGVKKGNVLILGPTGTGKTEILRIGSELLGFPFAEAKLASKTGAGFKGSNVETVLEDLYPHRTHPNYRKSIVSLDEIDKRAENPLSNNNSFGGDIQNELIGWVESAKLKVPHGQGETFDVDTTNMLFIAAGAFVGLEYVIAKRSGKKIDEDQPIAEYNKVLEDLYAEAIPEDLITYGLKPELMGRFPRITFTRPLDKPTLIEIMKNGKRSVVKGEVRLLQEGYGLTVNVEEEVYSILADAALQLQMGARGLERGSSVLFEDIKFNIKELTQGTTTLIITPQMTYERLRRLLPEDYKIA